MIDILPNRQPETATISPAPIAPTATITMRPARLDALTSLRFFAAALIVLHHSRGGFDLPLNWGAPIVLSQAVSFFFVLSGFILTYVYPSLQESGRRRFLLARFARLWPAHVTAFLLTISAVAIRTATPLHTLLAIIRADPRATVLNIAMLHAWIPIHSINNSFNAVSWSISTEFGFYFCFLWLIHNWQRTWWYKLPITFLFACTMIALANRWQASPDPNDVYTGLYYNNPLARVFEFTLGMTTALAWRRFAPKVRLSRWIGTLLEFVAIGGVIASMHYTLASATYLQAHFPFIGKAGSDWLEQGGFVCVEFAALIFVMALGKGFFSRLLSHPLPVLLGEISFSIYLIHIVLLSNYVSYPPLISLMVPTQFMFLLYWSVLLLSSYLVWSVIERPARRFIVGLWPQHPQSGNAPSRPASRTAPAGPPAGRRLVPLTTPTWLRSAVCALLLGAALVPFLITPTAPDITHLQQKKVATDYAFGTIGDANLAIRPVPLARVSYPSGITVSGWAVDTPDDRPALGVFLCLDDSTNIWSFYGREREDVAAHLHDSRYRPSNFTGQIPFALLTPGPHRLTIKIVTLDKKYYYQSDTIDLVVT
jgi:peptidoglycan/LPS O-acetylase OafA/YrhL